MASRHRLRWEHLPAGSWAPRAPRGQGAVPVVLWRCLAPRGHGDLGTQTQCAGLVLTRARERHLAECHGAPALPALVEAAFTRVPDRAEAHYGRTEWCECGTRKHSSTDACPGCRERDRYDRADRATFDLDEGAKSLASLAARRERAALRASGTCVHCRRAPAAEGLLNCRPCLIAASARNRATRNAKRGV